jgi:hypothetical protein
MAHIYLKYATGQQVTRLADLLVPRVNGGGLNPKHKY